MIIRRPRSAFTMLGEPEAQARAEFSFVCASGSAPSTCRPRSAFTLIELLIVMGIMVIIAALGYMLIPNLNKNKGVPNATTQLEGWIRVTKNQALRDGAPRGIRLIDDGGGHVTSLQYIEQPEPIAPRGAVGGNQIALIITTQPNPANVPPYPLLSNSIATLALINSSNQIVAGYNWDDPANPQIFGGDFLELSNGTSIVAQLTVNPQPGQGAQRSTLMLDRPIDGTDVNPLILTDGFKITRAPRPLQGEPLLQMHKDAYIDLTYSTPCPTYLTPNLETGTPPYSISADWSPSTDPGTGKKYLDILFNSSGQVANAPTGQIILCVRHVDRDQGGQGSDRLIIAIFTRTGKVTAVNWNDVPGADPFLLARDGKSSGL
jgi:prepilin-type N-terminal cleavage/methylation domain-containing protein